MLLIGLTGSIATGKSTVSALLASPPYSLPVIDADVLARRVVEPGTPGYRAIVSHFGPTTPDLLLPASATLSNDGPAGKGRPLDRAALGRKVFGADGEARRNRRVLNGIVHPAVRKAMAAAILKHHLLGAWAVVLDVPLLFDSVLDVFCGSVIMVGVRDGDVQLRRLLARDAEQGGSMTEEEARNRVASQGDVKSKVARVEARGDRWGEVVWNDGSKDDLRREVEKAVARIRGTSPRWWSILLWACPPLAFLAALRAYLHGRAARQKYEKESKQNLSGYDVRAKL